MDGTAVVEEFRETSSPGVLRHIESGLDGTIRGDGKWRPLPFGTCRTCQGSDGLLRAGQKEVGPSIQCGLHKDAKWRRPRPPGVKQWPFEADLKVPRG
jgi:hypothetical protein